MESRTRCGFVFFPVILHAPQPLQHKHIKEKKRKVYVIRPYNTSILYMEATQSPGLLAEGQGATGGQEEGVWGSCSLQLYL